MDGWIQGVFFLPFLSLYCVSGLRLEVNIQCLLPALPAIFHRLNNVVANEAF